jgi:endonuclease/exonuclease/phosphatase family metal-dependent hydrolase
MSGKSHSFRNLIFLVFFLLIILLGIYVLREEPSERVDQIGPPNQIKVMTFNINYGIGVDGERDLGRISNIIRRYSPDVICLQEVDYKTERSGGIDQARKIAADLGLSFTFGRNYRRDRGWSGNALLTRYPIYFSENKRYGYEKTSEIKGVLHTIVEIGDMHIHFYVTQLGEDSTENAVEIRELMNTILNWGTDEPTIVAGDLNTLSSNDGIREFLCYFKDVVDFTHDSLLTFPGNNPQNRLDYIFFNGFFTPVAVYTIGDNEVKAASHHLPLYARFKLK